MATQLKFGENLTRLPGEEGLRGSFAGMAHFAGTGPKWETCGACSYLGEVKKDEAFCLYPILNKAKKKIPVGASACKFFKAKAEE